jgi:soluble lytic murein transglycosylase-like protein
MSYASALTRVQELELRLGIVQTPVASTTRNFDKVLATARNGMANQGQKLLNIDASTAQTRAQGVQNDPYAPMTVSTREATRGLTPELNKLITRIANKHDVPVALVKAVAKAESGFRSDATSAAGAQGIMQLMPATGRGLGVHDPFNVEQNIEGGTRYLKNALRIFNGDYRKAIAAYNAGVNAVQRYGDVPPYAETQNYVRKVLGFAEAYGLKI